MKTRNKLKQLYFNAMYKRTEIAELMGISSRTLQRIINRENLPIRKNVRLTKKDVEKLDLRLKTNILRNLR
jgi:hypothetical protein